MILSTAIWRFSSTARQYGEVVLPDAATGQGPGTLASFAHRNEFSREGGKIVTVQGTPSPRLRRPKEGMAHFLPSWHKFYCMLARSRYNFDRSCEFIPGYKFGGGHWRSVAVQTVSEPEIYHGAEFKLHAD